MSMKPSSAIAESGAAIKGIRKFWKEKAKFKKGHFFGQKTFLTNTTFSVGENFYQKINKNQKINKCTGLQFSTAVFYLLGRYILLIYPIYTGGTFLLNITTFSILTALTLN